MRQSVFTIAPDAPFLATLASGIVDGTLLGDWPRNGPFWLSDVTILLPTRRARLALAEEFLNRGHSLLPDIRTLGGEDRAEEPFLPPVDLPALPTAISVLDRRLILARLVDGWAKRQETGAPPAAAEIFRLADLLGSLIDDLTIEGVEVEALRNIAPEEVAANWQQALKFLDIALQAWPGVLTERGKADVASLGNERLARQVSTAVSRYGDRPVIAAGSTGSIPATAGLIVAISRLSRGAVVLPGLDTSLGEDDLKTLGDPQKAPHAHPQYGLIKLLARLGLRPDAVTELAPAILPRTRLVRRALALADATTAWAQERQAIAPALPEALEGIALLAAPGEDFEARAIALAAREALAEGRTVGIISPDRNLARRIAAELSRHDIDVDDAAGTPLFQSAAGRLVRGLVALAVEKFAAVELMAVLRNASVTLGLARPEVGRLAELVELRLLRGQRPAPGLAGLRQALVENVERRTERDGRRLFPADVEAIAGLLDRLDAATAPLCGLLAAPAIDAAGLATALASGFAALTAPAPEGNAAPLPGGEELRQWAVETAAGREIGPRFAPTGLDAVLAALMAGFDVRPTRPGRADIAIWGRLEARLQHADLMVLAGLNEDVWPEPADPGPWLSRKMRLAMGLEPPERRQGQAAHDFEMAIGNRDVLLAYATRRGASPALPSPLLQRLEAFIGEQAAAALRAKGDRWLDTARAVDVAASTRPAGRPAPRPPAYARPRQLSVTEIETLFRSPYDIYARHVLKLRALDALGEEPGARERGTMIHDVFGRFVNEGHDFSSPGALDRLKTMANDAFAGLEAIGERRDIWLRRFDRAAELFLAFERERQPRVLARHAEIRGEWPFPLLDNFRLIGRADRIDELVDGGLELIDFKTGAVPSPGAMRDFLAPQLPLEAAMARAGAFAEVPPSEAAALTYIKIGLGPEAFVLKPFALGEGATLTTAADTMEQRLQRLVAALLLTDTLPMTAQVLPDIGKRYRGEYEHLARTEEWAVAEDDDIP